MSSAFTSLILPHPEPWYRPTEQEMVAEELQIQGPSQANLSHPGLDSSNTDSPASLLASVEMQDEQGGKMRTSQVSLLPSVELLPKAWG